MLLTIFLVALMIPLQFNIGPALLNPHRLFLVLTFVPFFGKWLSGDKGKVYGVDFLFLSFVLWMDLSIFVVHGFARYELIVMNTIETFGSYLVGRVLVRNQRDFDRILKFLSITLMIFVPAAILESFTGIRVFAAAADLIGKTHPWIHADGTYQKRLGMYRSQMVFEHPILFGVFASTAFGLLYYTNRPNDDGVYGYRRAWLSFVTVFFSLSSGATLSLGAQMGMAGWDWIMGKVRNHWKLLIGLIVLAYVVVDLISNRTPIQVFITYAAFSAQNGYMRINIFIYGMDNVWANPIFGIGMKNWIRPSWMGSSSVDNYWLLMAMRHGFPGFILVASTFLTIIISLGRLKIHDVYVANMRKGLVVALIGLSLSLMTVHMWGQTYAFVCFLLGSGMWMRDYAAEHPDPETEDGDTAPAPRERGKPAPRQAAAK
jgi:O-Antigen ligase